MKTKLSPIEIEILDALCVPGAVIKKWKEYFVWSRRMKDKIKDDFFFYLQSNDCLIQTATSWHLSESGKEMLEKEKLRRLLPKTNQNEKATIGLA